MLLYRPLAWLALAALLAACTPCSGTGDNACPKPAPVTPVEGGGGGGGM